MDEVTLIITHTKGLTHTYPHSHNKEQTQMYTCARALIHIRIHTDSHTQLMFKDTTSKSISHSAHFLIWFRLRTRKARAVLEKAASVRCFAVQSLSRLRSLEGLLHMGCHVTPAQPTGVSGE